MILYSKSMCLFVGSGFLVSHHGLRKPRHFYSLSPLETMSNHNWQVFHLISGTYFPFHATVRICWTLSHLPSPLNQTPNTPPNQTPNAMSIYQPCTPMHMQCKMPLHVSSCYMYNTLHGTIYKPYFMSSTMDNYIESI